MTKLWLLPFAALVACAAHPTPAQVTTSHTIFMQLDGVVVTPGSADDPASNTSIAVTSPATIDPYAPAGVDRAVAIAAIVADMQAALAPYDLDVVTLRPDQGAYDMIVVTSDSAQAIGLDDRVLSVAPDALCAAAKPPIVGYLFAGTWSVHAIASSAIAMTAQDHGVPPSTTAGDCMCTTCALATAACTIGGAGTPIATNSHCRLGVMDEGAEFARVYGPR